MCEPTSPVAPVTRAIGTYPRNGSTATSTRRSPFSHFAVRLAPGSTSRRTIPIAMPPSLGDATELRTSPTWFPESSMSWAPCGGASVLAARSPRKCRFTAAEVDARDLLPM